MLLLSTTGAVTIESWSLGDIVNTSNTWQGAHVYQAQLTRGHGDNRAHVISVTVRDWRPGGGESVVVSVSGHHCSGYEMFSPQLRLFKQAHPPWVSLAAWTVDYKYYTLWSSIMKCDEM